MKRLLLILEAGKETTGGVWFILHFVLRIQKIRQILSIFPKFWRYLILTNVTKMSWRKNEKGYFCYYVGDADVYDACGGFGGFL